MNTDQEQGANYSVVAWWAHNDRPDESDGDILGEWAASTIAIAERAMWSELHAIFDGRFPDDGTLIVEVRKFPTQDALGNPV